MTGTSKIKIIYIAGYGRSGTTLMSIALGQHIDIFGAGEITELSRHAWANNTYCSCGHPLHDCSYWSSVVERWLLSRQPLILKDYRECQIQFENLLTMKVMDFGVWRTANFARFAQRTEELFHHIAAASGKSIIVDSSKMPARAWALTRMSGLDVYIIHMVRDGRGVAWSLAKGYKRNVEAGLQRELVPKSVLRTGVRWAMVNLEAEYLQRIVGSRRYVRVRYEDFVTDPVATINRIGELVGADLRGIGMGLHRGEVLKPHHQIAGNRLRMNPTITVARDESWHSQMPETKKRTFTWLCWWLLRRYDYV